MHVEAMIGDADGVIHRDPVAGRIVDGMPTLLESIISERSLDRTV